MLAAALKTPLFLLSPAPWPKIVTGHPLLGFGPDGRKRLK
jgi:hypothetical protein